MQLSECCHATCIWPPDIPVDGIGICAECHDWAGFIEEDEEDGDNGCERDSSGTRLAAGV